ncbi:MAG: DUF5011 domain-containing protein, partial [Chloroflexi bacterium]|nr:DUF5011 domain-containing protein [Chloroflexota bacterium]
IYTVERLAYAPSSPDLVFAACWRGVFRSADGGETWKKLIDAPFPDFYGAVAVDPQDANIVMVASGGRYQYSPFASALGFATPYTAPAGYYWRSTDGGNTFVQAAGTGLPENFAATDLWIDPSSPPGNRLVILATFDGIFRSSDGGRTFVASSEGLTHPYVWDMDGGVHSDGRSVVYVTLQLSGRDPSVFDPGVFRSTDGGTTWKNVTGNIPTFDPDVNDGFWDWSVAVHPTNPDVAYVLNGNNDSIKSGVFKTINRGQSWTHVTADWTKPGFVAGYLSALTGQPGRSGNFLAISKADPSRLVFGNLFEIYHTSDGGATWQECYSGKVNADPADRRYASRGSEDTFVYDFAFDPADPSILWIGFEDVFMWETRDRGASMAHLQPEMAMLIRNRSADACWQLLPDPKRRGAYYAAMASPSSGVYLASGAVVYSTDGGKSWIDISGNLPLGRPELVLGPPPEGQTLPTIYAAVTGHGMFKTTDHGQTWSEMATGFQGGEKTNVYRLAIDAGNPSQLWVGLTTDLATVDTTGGLYRTRDGGDTWAKLAQFPAREVFALEFHQGKLYAGAATEVSDNAEGGIFVSSDDGDTWTRVMDQLFIRAITFDPNDANILYAAASMPPNLSQPPKLNPGIFRSADGGATWPQISQDLPHYALTSLAVDPLNSSHLYVGTLGLGALRAVLSSGGPPTYTLSGLADYDGSATGAIIISVYADATFTNKTGQVTLIAPGSYSISGLQAGSYFIRAFRDMNGNGMVDASEPLYRATASLSLPPDASEVNFSLQDPLPSDTEPPVITVDPAKISVALSGPEPNLLFGVRAQDNRDGDRTSQITAQGTVNVTVPGAYTVRYQVTDASGNAAAPATRVYHVRGKLTFVANFDSYAELSELSEKVPELAEPENRATVAEMFDRYVEEGYGAISFHPVTTVSGRVGFAPSPGVDLAAKGYRDGAPPPFADGTDRLRWAVEQAQRRGLTVFANIQAFSHVAKNTSHTVPGAQPLSDREIEAVVDLLVRPSRQGGYGFNGVTGELLPARWFPIVRRVTAAHGATHMHDTDRQEVVSDQELDYPPTLVWETLPDADILSLEEYGLRRIGPNTVMVGIARHLNRPLAIRSSTFGFTSPDDTGGFPGVYGPETVGNIFLFRRIQTGVET